MAAFKRNEASKAPVAFETREGFLKKLSPNAFAGWQERYFKMTDSGSVLAYWKGKPDGSKEPQGLVSIGTVRDVVIRNAVEFALISTERDWILKASSAKEKDEWVAAIKYNLQKIRETRTVEDEEMKEEFTSILKKKAGGGGGVTTGVVSMVNNLVAINKKQETEQMRADLNSSEEKRMFLAAKNLFGPLTEAWKGPSEDGFLENVLFGALMAETGGEGGAGTKSVKHWALLISSRPIVKGKAQQPLPCNLFDVNLPLGVVKDKLFLFRPVSDGEGPATSVELLQLACKPAITDRPDGFAITLDFGSKAPTEVLVAMAREDAVTWSEGIFSSVRGARALLQGRDLPVDQELEVFDRADKGKLLSSIQLAFKETLAQLFFDLAGDRKMHPNDLAAQTQEHVLVQLVADHWEDIPLTSLLPALENFSNSCANLLDAAIQADPARKDICQFVVANYTRRVCKCLSAVWHARVADHLPPSDVLELVEFLSIYHRGFESFGILDREVHGALEDLAEASARRILSNLRSPVLYLIKNEAHAVPFREGDGPLQTTAPVDLFRLFADQVATASRIKEPVLTVKVVEVCRAVVATYQQTMRELFIRQGGPDGSLDLEYLEAQLNNTSLFVEKCREITKLSQLQEGGAMEVATLKEEAQKFNSIAMILKCQIVSRFCRPVDELMKKKRGVGHINTENLVSGILLPILTQIDEDILPGYGTKVVDSILDRVLLRYVKQILSRGDADVTKLHSKIVSDYKALGRTFDGSIPRDRLMKKLAVLQDISAILTTDATGLALKVTDFRKKYGRGFNLAVLKCIVFLRSDLGTQSKSEYIEICQHALQAAEKMEASAGARQSVAQSVAESAVSTLSRATSRIGGGGAARRKTQGGGLGLQNGLPVMTGGGRGSRRFSLNGAMGRETLDGGRYVFECILKEQEKEKIKKKHPSLLVPTGRLWTTFKTGVKGDEANSPSGRQNEGAQKAAASASGEAATADSDSEDEEAELSEHAKGGQAELEWGKEMADAHRGSVWSTVSGGAMDMMSFLDPSVALAEGSAGAGAAAGGAASGGDAFTTDDDVVMQGWVYKKGALRPGIDGVNKSAKGLLAEEGDATEKLQKHWAVLRVKALSFYASQGDAISHASFAVKDLQSAKEDEKDECKFALTFKAFAISQGSSIVELIADTDVHRQTWVEAVTDCIAEMEEELELEEADNKEGAVKGKVFVANDCEALFFDPWRDPVDPEELKKSILGEDWAKEKVEKTEQGRKRGKSFRYQRSHSFEVLDDGSCSCETVVARTQRMCRDLWQQCFGGAQTLHARTKAFLEQRKQRARQQEQQGGMEEEDD
uniref:PH domain-containing protein n=1 Tax=Chromera velia CCMP2878 TaxID=1169474 RepID=A0A0G4GI63_9ALVE|eukprot:Cvel_22002.t1-p1 / transcript=Cvel_22002.t1 / gene=Cvel_22002 / organism=Chromera_velia_CCMP2878 / gene_product=hypothetical protein / transcript_product=hypothetical protein / location=Cvel_scaffold2120:13733-23754(-) / protein_length=1328 / sequence_SO=supercontig / SO=protein_coding / is_pseudo=false